MEIVIITGMICLTVAVIISGFFVFFCEPISNYIDACTEAKRNREERFKLIDAVLKKKLEEESEKHD